jgi:hypothetical protein
MAQRILANLPQDDYERLLPNLQPVTLPVGKVLYEASVRMDYVYIPTTCVISLLHTIEDGSIAGMGVVGHGRHRTVSWRDHQARPRSRAGLGSGLANERQSAP